jgi:hypothetical protein
MAYVDLHACFALGCGPICATKPEEIALLPSGFAQHSFVCAAAPPCVQLWLMVMPTVGWLAGCGAPEPLPDRCEAPCLRGVQRAGDRRGGGRRGEVRAVCLAVGRITCAYLPRVREVKCVRAV